MTTFASLFTGFGLADIGAMMAGCKLLWGVELDSAIARVCENNLNHQDQLYTQSVIDVDFTKLELPDILWASPPCPSFSKAKLNAVETSFDKALAEAIVNAISILKPRAFILENVEGYKNSESLKLIRSALYRSGYMMDQQVLNSADFGVPQTRRRLILRAVRGFLPALPQKQKWKSWYQAIEDLIPGLPESPLAQWQLKILPETILIDMSLSTSTLKPLLISGCANNYSSSVSFRKSHEPALTVTKSFDRQVSRIYLTSCQVVMLNSRALARFQTLPDWYELPSHNSLAYKGIGNGVPCLLSQKVIQSILRAFEWLAVS